MKKTIHLMLLTYVVHIFIKIKEINFFLVGSVIVDVAKGIGVL